MFFYLVHTIPDHNHFGQSSILKNHLYAIRKWSVRSCHVNSMVLILLPLEDRIFQECESQEIYDSKQDGASSLFFLSQVFPKVDCKY